MVRAGHQTLASLWRVAGGREGKHAWPRLTFLTINDFWDASVQTRSRDNHWEKCGSDPRAYHELGIPCWRFEVNPHTVVTGNPIEIKTDDDVWARMLLDAVRLGSNPHEWRITSQDAFIIGGWKWEKGKWVSQIN